MTLKRPIATLIVLLITLAILGYLLAQIAARGSQSNFFNRSIRPIIVASPFWRTVFNFHDYGDGRRDYLKPGAKVRFNVYAMEGLEVDNDVFEELAAEASKVTNRNASYRIVTTHIPYQASVSKIEQGEIVKKYDQAIGYYSDVYVFLLSLDDDNSELIGSTANQNSTVIFYNSIKLFTGDNKKTTPNYILSTILHEFGHLLGLEHTQQESCLMLEHAETDHVPKVDPNAVIIHFCQAELGQVKANQN